ncbi:MAG: MFS transporter, partial [Acidobacteria bacterium]
MDDRSAAHQPMNTLDPAPALWDAGFAWFLFLFFLLNVGMGVFPPLLPQIMGGLDFSFAMAGLLGAAFGLARFLTDLPVGLLVERLGFAPIMHAGLALFVAGTVLSAVAPSFEAMLAARALLGFGSGAGNIVAILYLMQTGAASQRNRRANLYELSVIAGMAVSADLGGMVGGRWGWRWSFWVAAAVFAGAWVVAAGPVSRALGAVQATLAGPPEVPTGVERGKPAASVMLAIYFAMFTQAFAWGGGIATLLPLYGGSGLALSSEGIGRIMALAFWVEVCLLFPVGWATDAWGKLRIMLPGFFAIGIGVAAAPMAGGVVGYGAAFSLLTSGMSVWMTAPALLREQL